MAAFKALFILELKRFINKKNLVILMLFLIISLFLVQTHINQYNDLVENNRKFNEIEKLKVNQFLNYTQYGLYGFRVFFNPSPLSIFFSHSGAFRELTSNIDAGEKMNFYSSVKGRTLFGHSAVGFMDFAGIIMLLGSLFVLYTGYESLRHKEYQKFLSSVAGYRRIFFSVVSWRASFSIFFFFLVTGASLLLVKLNGIKIPDNEFHHLLVYVVVMVMMLLVFFAGGLVGGSFKSRVTGVITVICLWFALVFFVPWLVQAIMLKSSESIRSNCRMELEKLTILMNFEKEAYQKVGIFKSGKEAPAKVKELVEGYWQNEFKAILAVEESLKDELKRNIRRFETVSLFFPTTFYLLTNNSISSKGYGNFIAFYDYVQRLKQDFFRFYLDRKFYSDFSGVESFVRKDENIYFAHSRLPGNILAGIAVMFFYAGGGFAFSFNRFKSFLFEQPGSAAKDLDGLDVELKKKETYVLLTGGSVVNNQVYNVLSGQGKGFKGNIRLDDEALVTGCPFVYLCPPGRVPGDIRVGDFIRFVRKMLKVSNKAAAELYLRLGVEHIEDKTFMQLSPVERADVFLAAALLKKSPLYMFHDFTRGMPEEFITRFAGQLQRLKEQGAAVLYLTDDVLLASKIGDSAGSLRAAAAAASPKLDTSGLV